MSKRALQLLEKAALMDPGIMTSKEDYQDHPGNDPDYLAKLGLTKQILKQLEQKLLARQGMVNIKKTGYRTRWLLFKEAK